MKCFSIGALYTVVIGIESGTPLWTIVYPGSRAVFTRNGLSLSEVLSYWFIRFFIPRAAFFADPTYRRGLRSCFSNSRQYITQSEFRTKGIDLKKFHVGGTSACNEERNPGANDNLGIEKHSRISCCCLKMVRTHDM